jgi:hypothetical protein
MRQNSTKDWRRNISQILRQPFKHFIALVGGERNAKRHQCFVLVDHGYGVTCSPQWISDSGSVQEDNVTETM